MESEEIKLYPLIYDENYNVVILNEIIKGKQTMTLQEAKLLRLLITQVTKEDKDFRTYSLKIKDLAKYLNVADANLYRDIKLICDTLMTRVIKLHTKDPKKHWKTIQWLQLAEYDGKGTIKLMLSSQIEPYILELNSWFTKYPIKEIFSMSSFYAIRIYELIKMQQNILKNHKVENVYVINFDLFYLREALDCENKFKQIGQFKSKVLDISIKEINKHTNITTLYEYIKNGKKVVGIKFLIQEKTKKELENNRIKILNTSKNNNNNNNDLVILGTSEQTKIGNNDIIVNILDTADCENQNINLEKEKNQNKVQEKVEKQNKKENKFNTNEFILELRKVIVEPISDHDLYTLLRIAENNIELIKNKYTIAKIQGNIRNLTAWLIDSIKKDYKQPIELQASSSNNNHINRFANYDQRNWDFDELKKMERELLFKETEKSNEAYELAIKGLEKNPQYLELAKIFDNR